MVKPSAFLSLAAMVLISTLLISGLISGLTPARADITCSASEESGIWINPKAEATALARIEIQTTCNLGERGWKIRALTRCARTECSWGYAAGVRRADGALAALYSTFTAERLIRMLVDKDSMKIVVVSAFRGSRENAVHRYVFERKY